MYKILKAETLAAKIHLMVVHAPRVASHCQPGQFIIVKMDEKGERIPLTICDYDREEGTVTIVFQEVGASTIRMSELKAGDSFREFPTFMLQQMTDLTDVPVWLQRLWKISLQTKANSTMSVLQLDR